MVKSKNATSNERLTPESFVLQAIDALKTEKKGVHVVRSGFNQAFRNYFGDEADPIETTTQMRRDGKIAVFLATGGVLLYLRENLKETTLSRHDADWEKRDQQGFEKKRSSKPTGGDDDVLAKILKG